LEECKSNLHLRIILLKGDKPLTHMDVCTSLIAWKSDNNLENYFENDLIFGGEPDGG